MILAAKAARDLGALVYLQKPVDIEVLVHRCLLKNAEVALARPQSGAEMTITLLDTRQSRKVRTSFPADASTIPWPRDLDLAPGATYAMRLPGRGPRPGPGGQLR